MELYVKDRNEWRKWLEKNHLKKQEVWLIYYKKPSGKPRIPYDDAVEEALCFGWIDGKIKRINDDYFIQRFTPRRKGSRWSKYNIDRVQRMIDEGKMTKAGLDSYQDLIDNPGLAYEDRRDGTPVIPDDLIKELKKNRIALKNFGAFPESSRRIYIEWLNAAKRDDTKIRRIAYIVDRCDKNQKPGML